ncbi:hypothetical protein [Streptomyces aureus]|uniref:hypothetical protein n=1 Tax=Streptomyces aureus TaxID=193461 RepID=UPI00099B6960|nr:hypothetical protein [Streptomyces aureus]
MRRDRTDRSPRRPRSPGRLGRLARVATTVTALWAAASGCVVVHGEREVVPATTRADAARALADFTAAYNKADATYDRSKDADRVTGPLAAIDAARLKAGRAGHPGGNPAHSPLAFDDARFSIPAKAGWPRWFVADATANKGVAGSRWLLVFTRDDLREPWQASYLTVLGAGDVPRFATDADGWAQPVAADDPALAVEPGKLGRSYATYLRSGGDSFAAGIHTSQWRAQREKYASRPGLARQYIDEPLSSGSYAPVGLRTADGGALVFFTTRRFEKETAAAGTEIPAPGADVQALTTGEINQSLTLEFVSNQAALDPPKGSGDGRVAVLGRVEGLTGAKGE